MKSSAKIIRRKGAVAGIVVLMAAAQVAVGAEGIVVPFQMRGGRVMVPVEVNGSEPRSFMMDTGFEMTFLSAAHADELKLDKVGQVTIAGIAGDEEANVFKGVKFRFSEREWSPGKVAAFPHPVQKRSWRRPGVLGSEFFKEFVVEVNPKREELTLYEPKGFELLGGGAVISMEFRRTTPIVVARITVPGRAPIEGRFEIDTGCDGGLCLGEHFVKKHDLVAAVGATRLSGRIGVGGGVDTRSGWIPQFEMGGFVVEMAETNFFLEGSPARRGMAGHIGSGILNHFKVVYDYSRKRMILADVE